MLSYNSVSTFRKKDGESCNVLDVENQTREFLKRVSFAKCSQSPEKLHAIEHATPQEHGTQWIRGLAGVATDARLGLTAYAQFLQISQL